MNEDNISVTIDAPKAFVTFERTVSARQYEPVKASLMLQIPTEPMSWRNADGTFNKERVIADAKEVFFVAKAVIYEQLGIEYTITPELVVQEILEKAFGAVEVAPETATNIAESRNAAQATPAAQPQYKSDEKLTGRAAWEDLAANPNNWFDNRNDKRNPAAPDFKRKRTGEGLWLTGRNGKSAVPSGIDLSHLGV